MVFLAAMHRFQAHSSFRRHELHPNSTSLFTADGLDGAEVWTRKQRPITRATVILLANIILGVVAGCIYRELELPTELTARTETARVIARLNSSMPPQDWEELMSSLGASASGLQADVIAVETGTLHTLPANWDYSSSMFFAFTVATTIGYGTFAPVTRGGRIFTIFYACVSIPLMLSAFINLCDVILRALAKTRCFSGKNRDLPTKVFKMMDVDRSGALDEAEVLQALKLMGLGEYAGKRATPLKRRRFKDCWQKCDVDGSGGG